MKTAVPKRYERSRPDRTSDALATLGAGTIIRGWHGSPSLPCGRPSGSPSPREAGRHRTSPTPRDHRVSPATAALAGYHLRPPGASIPPWCACLRLGLSSGAFRLLTAPHSLPRRMNRRHGVKCISALEDPTQSPTPLSTDSPEQGRQVNSCPYHMPPCGSHTLPSPVMSRRSICPIRRPNRPNVSDGRANALAIPNARCRATAKRRNPSRGTC